jgi:hypothetical protein
MNVESLKLIAEKRAEISIENVDLLLVEQSVKYLSSPAAMLSLDDDPYRPKWSSPWWQMMALFELGMVAEIPAPAIEKMVIGLDKHFLKFFPFRLEDVPPGFDPVRNVQCHCAWGTMHQLLHAYGVDVDERLPWIRPWYLRYQLADGGLNCDEAAFTRSSPKSSVVSTLPPLEAVLYCTGREFSDKEKQFLDSGAKYLLERKLIRSASTGEIIEPQWQKLCFPRFYFYDQLRGLSFVLEWAARLKRQLALSDVAEVIERIDADFPDGIIRVQRSALAGSMTRMRDFKTGEWIRRQAGLFPLLEKIGEENSAVPSLTKVWSQAKRNLAMLLSEGLAA